MIIPLPTIPEEGEIVIDDDDDAALALTVVGATRRSVKQKRARATIVAVFLASPKLRDHFDGLLERKPTITPIIRAIVVPAYAHTGIVVKLTEDEDEDEVVVDCEVEELELLVVACAAVAPTVTVASPVLGGDASSFELMTTS